MFLGVLPNAHYRGWLQLIFDFGPDDDVWLAEPNDHAEGRYEPCDLSYLSPVPQEMLRIAIEFASGAERVESRFQIEPGMEIMRLERLDHGGARLTWLSDSRADYRDRSNLAPPEPDFSWTVADPDALAHCVLEGYEHMIEALGQNEWANRWGGTFPHERLAVLKQVLDLALTDRAAFAAARLSAPSQGQP